MTNKDGKLVGANALDAVAVAEERYPGAKLIGVQTTLILQPRGRRSVAIVNVIKERD